MSQTAEKTGITALLDNAALEVKKRGGYAVELNADQLRQLMFQVFVQSEKTMKDQGISAVVNALTVKIAEGRGEVSTVVTASKRIGFLNPSAQIRADFALTNIVDREQKPTGELETVRLVVTPQKLFGLIEPLQFLEPHLGGTNINPTIDNLLAAEMQRRGVFVTDRRKLFTPSSVLRVEVTGRPR